MPADPSWATGPQRLDAPPEAADDDPPATALMTHDLIGIVPDAAVDVALRLMVHVGVRHLPVMEGSLCTGLVHETDLALASTVPGRVLLTVGDLCRPAPELHPGDRRGAAASVMHTGGTDAALVVQGDRLVGILTATDLIRSLAADVHRLPRQPLGAPTGEGPARPGAVTVPRTRRSVPVPIDLDQAVTQALRAPSVHNTQPWRWRIGTGTVELHADRNRQLDATDPGRRDLLLSCGAALHHLRVAVAAAGLAAEVDLLPDPNNSDHLATLTLRPGPPDADAAALHRAIALRCTDRRRMSHWPVPAGQVRALVDAAHRYGALLVPVEGDAARGRLAAALDDAARRQAFVPGYAAELRTWTSRYSAARDGVPATSVAPSPVGMVGPSPLRRFPHGELRQPHMVDGPRAPDDAAALLVLATAADEVRDQVLAGEATSAVLLTATRLGLATTPLSQGMEVDATRERIRRDVLRIPELPQLLLRIGLPAEHAEELPPTPRRDLRAVLLPG
ncbi:MAG: hypothetical protein QOF00_3528 [Pseudonocardiales bacterium]|nr:hypothetical protein [Pseudonocardiales bacterium]